MTSINQKGGDYITVPREVYTLFESREFISFLEAVADEITPRIDDLKRYFGTGKDAGIWYDGTDLHIDAQLVGSGTIILDNLPVSAAGLASGAVWNNSGVLNIV